MKNKLILDYIMSLTHLYGLVHRDKVVEVYNMQNDDKISEANMSVILKEGSEELVENFIEIHFSEILLLERESLAKIF